MFLHLDSRVDLVRPLYPMLLVKESLIHPKFLQEDCCNCLLVDFVGESCSVKSGDTAGVHHGRSIGTVMKDESAHAIVRDDKETRLVVWCPATRALSTSSMIWKCDFVQTHTFFVLAVHPVRSPACKQYDVPEQLLWDEQDDGRAINPMISLSSTVREIAKNRFLAFNFTE
jgi:hypothetical protein